MADAGLADRLISGGDHRLVLRAGLNDYGCPPLPDDDLAALGSCTASPISRSALQAILPLDERLQGGAQPSECWPELLADWLSTCHFPPTTGIFPSGSGTELHGQFLQALRRQHPGQALHVVTAPGNETGRGVPALLQGADQIHCIDLRDPAGHPRPIADINHDFHQAIAATLADSAHCLVISHDLSKSGLQAPGPGCLENFAAAQAQGHLTVLVDACQFRCRPETLLAYLQRDWWVAITGSKFFGGPSFSGLLLHAQKKLPEPLPDNAGLLLRTAAALHELRRFQALPTATVRTALLAFAHTLETGIAAGSHLRLLETRAPERTTPEWDSLPSQFLLQLGPSTHWASEAVLRAYRQQCLLPTAAAPRVLLGQPVALSATRHALRLCCSARWVLEAQQMGLTTACTELARQIVHLDRQAQLAIAG